MTITYDPEVQRRRLRIALRDIRQTLQKTQKQVAQAMDWSPSKLLRIETGETSISVSDLTALLGHYEVTDQRRTSELVEMAKVAKRQTWASYRDVFTPEFMVYLGYESSASRIRQFHPMLIPGLLQTEEYARAIAESLRPKKRSDPDVDRQIQARMERQELLSRDGPPEMFFILDEAVVRRAVGRGNTMVRQLNHLKELNRRSNVNIQIIRFSAGAHGGMRGPFVVLDFPDPADDDLLFLESARGDAVSEDVAPYLELFFELEDLATPKARLDEVMDELIAELDGKG